MRQIDNPYAVVDRVALTQKKRVELWLEHSGICIICKVKIVGKWIVEHFRPLWDWPEGTPKDVANAWENLGPACIKCARRKTNDEATARSKMRNKVAKAIGAHRRKGPPMAGSRDSPWKRKVDGTVVRRDEE